MRERLLHALRRLWPQYTWKPANAGSERIFSCYAAPYEISVEWANNTSTVTFTRTYSNESLPIIGIGTAVGMSAEGIRRAYLDAAVAWRKLHEPPPMPVRETPADVVKDQHEMQRAFGKEDKELLRIFGLLKDDE